MTRCTRFKQRLNVGAVACLGPCPDHDSSCYDNSAIQFIEHYGPEAQRLGILLCTATPPALQPTTIRPERSDAHRSSICVTASTPYMFDSSSKTYKEERACLQLLMNVCIIAVRGTAIA